MSDQLKTILKKAGLKALELKEFENVLRRMPKKNFEELVDFLNDNPAWIKKLHENYKEKMEVDITKKGGAIKMKRIINKEKKELNSFKE